MSDRPSPARDTRGIVAEALTEYRTQFPGEHWLGKYVDMHHERYQLLMDGALRLLSKVPINAPTDQRAGHEDRQRVLAIGPRFEVDLLHRLRPDLVVDTLGLNAGLFPLHEGERYVEFDLNDSDIESHRPAIGPYRLIVMAEVIEHLWMAPSVILPWLKSLLIPGGHLIVQTPNAVSLPHRLRMVIGINPFQELATDRALPGHIREYTVKEMTREGRAAGFEIAELRTANYFDSDKRTNRLYERMERVIPKNLRAGITVIYRRPAS